METSEGRKPPAYQEYASSMLANRAFRLMDASTRGVFYTMRLELWANDTLPTEPDLLSKMLGLVVDEVKKALPKLEPFFTFENGEIRSPELDGYRAHLEHRRKKQSQGGKTGASLTNDKLGRSGRQKNDGP
jgi:hypothetical protein